VLASIQIEDVDLSERQELMAVLNDIVTLRAVVGSPLKSFTFLGLYPELPKMFELIGKDGSFAMEQVEVTSASNFELGISLM
jgi:hypothetical protein